MTVLRFAPSPNGELHLGHAYSALVNADLAHRLHGRMLLRIEDIDIERCRPAFETQIYADLSWLGVKWELPVRRQSEQFDEYRAALDRLVEADLAYPAFMSRSEVRTWIAEEEARTGLPWPRDPDGAPRYPPHDREQSKSNRILQISSGVPYAWRLDMRAAIKAAGRRLTWREFDLPSLSATEIAATPQVWGDVVIARSDTPTSYHLSVVVDDALQGVTHVVRGRDLYQATSVHRLLQTLLGLPEPAYHHHRLILDGEGRKLAKSEGSTGLRTLREAGASPDQIREMTGLPAAPFALR